MKNGAYYNGVIYALGNGTENGNYHSGLYRDFYDDPFLHS